MLIVDAELVGPMVYARLVRDGSVVPATSRYGLPADIVGDAAIRAWCVGPSVPPHTVLSGLAGLWVWCAGEWPGAITVVGKRGLHRVVSPSATARTHDRVTYHSGLAWSDEATWIGPIAVASRARCCSDALRWEAHRKAIPTVAGLVASQQVDLDELRHEVLREDPRGAGFGRLHEVWTVLYPVLGQLGPQGRHGQSA